MRTVLKKWWLIALAIPAIALVACSTDSPVQVFTPDGESFDEAEYVEMMENGQVDAMGNRIKEESGEVKRVSSASKIKSSSSAKSSSSVAKTSSSSTKASSSSVKESSSSKTSSSSVKESSASEKSSSSVKESSSSKTSSSSVEESSESKPASSAEPPESSETASSSSEEAQQESTGCLNGECAIGSNVMDDVDDETKTELDSLKELVDNGDSLEDFEVLPEGLTGETFNYDFLEENDVYCYTGEGEWLHVEREELGKYINHFKNGAAWGQLEKFEIVFMDACTEVYFRHK